MIKLTKLIIPFLEPNIAHDTRIFRHFQWYIWNLQNDRKKWQLSDIYKHTQFIICMRWSCVFQNNLVHLIKILPQPEPLFFTSNTSKYHSYYIGLCTEHTNIIIIEVKILKNRGPGSNKFLIKWTKLVNFDWIQLILLSSYFSYFFCLFAFASFENFFLSHLDLIW